MLRFDSFVPTPLKKRLGLLGRVVFEASRVNSRGLSARHGAASVCFRQHDRFQMLPYSATSRYIGFLTRSLLMVYQNKTESPRHRH
jgi:hypothetical protein